MLAELSNSSRTFANTFAATPGLFGEMLREGLRLWLMLRLKLGLWLVLRLKLGLRLWLRLALAVALSLRVRDSIGLLLELAVGSGLSDGLTTICPCNPAFGGLAVALDVGLLLAGAL